MQPLTLTTRDGTELSATLFPASGPANDGAFAVVGGATGVPQRFYRAFATSLAAEGVSVLTFDFRGIGQSRPTHLRGFSASYVDWAEGDLAAAVEFALERGPTTVVGHSFGGHAFGLLPRVNETRGLYVFGSGSGCSVHMTASEALKVWTLWNVVAPPLTRAFGYLPMKRLGMGEDLPLGVYRQWRRWCSFPRYFLEDGNVDFAERYARVRADMPVVAVNATDDLWSSPAAARALFGGLTAVDVRYETPTPQSLELGSIGHMGYFRRDASALWKGAARFVKSGGVKA